MPRGWIFYEKGKKKKKNNGAGENANEKIPRREAVHASLGTQ